MELGEGKKVGRRPNPEDVESVKNFRKKICEFYRDVFKQAGVELPKDFEESRKKDVDKGHETSKKINFPPFDTLYLPSLTARKSPDTIDYCVIKNFHHQLFTAKDVGAYGRGVEFTTDKKINVGLFVPWGGKEESEKNTEL